MICWYAYVQTIISNGELRGRAVWFSMYCSFLAPASRSDVHICAAGARKRLPLTSVFALTSNCDSSRASAYCFMPMTPQKPKDDTGS